MLAAGLVLGSIFIDRFNDIKSTRVGDLVGVFSVEGGSYSLLKEYVFC